MRFKKQKEEEPMISIAPLIDILFLLLIFFMVTSHFDIASGVQINLPDVTISVTCSSGTYIRSLAADLGRRLGPGAHLISLRRLKSGTFDVRDALELGKLVPFSNDSVYYGKVIPLSEALPDILEIQVDNLMARRIRNGYQPGWNEVMRSDLPDFFEGYLKLIEGQEFVAIGKAAFSQGKGKTSFKIVRVFH